LTAEEIGGLLEPYVGVVGADICAQLAVYLELILKWNARMNLTAIREPEEIVRRHFGESLFAGRILGSCGTLLDFGSGAGFPGLPIAILRPDLRVTLAESQNKKASFLREVVRTLGLNSEVWAGRVETMPGGRQFDTVTLRAVDHMAEAIVAGEPRASRQIMLLVTTDQTLPDLPEFSRGEPIPIPNSTNGCLLRLVRTASPRSITE